MSHNKKDLQNAIYIQTVYDTSVKNSATFTCKKVKTNYLLATNILLFNKRKINRLEKININLTLFVNHKVEELGQELIKIFLEILCGPSFKK